jgi:uncharacterized protein (TIGR00288 family)
MIELPFTKRLQHHDQRVAVFIDVQNMYHSAKHLFKARVNFKEVLKESVSGRRLVRAIGYVVRSEGEEEKSFFEALVKLGIELKSKELQVFYGGLKKADWDVGIALDAANLADSVDVIVLVSGDGDFIPLIEYLDNRGKIVEVVAFAKSASSKLQQKAHSFVDLGADSRRFILKSRSNRH